MKERGTGNGERGTEDCHPDRSEGATSALRPFGRWPQGDDCPFPFPVFCSLFPILVHGTNAEREMPTRLEKGLSKTPVSLSASCTASQREY